MYKAWGKTELLVRTESFEAHRIEVRRGGYCSLHIHKYKYNMIRVETGTLHIDIPTMSPHVLHAGQSVTIPPGTQHRFRAHEDTIAYEFYWLGAIDPEDIVRFDQGGMS